MTLRLFAAALAAAVAIPAHAQEWPTRPLTMVVALTPGGPIDTLARNLQPYLAEALGQQVVVENISGGAGVTGSLRVANSPVDAHIFTLGSIGTHAIGQSMHKKPPYDSLKDFTPVSLVADAPQVLLIKKDLPVTNLKEFAAYAKANQDKMFHASGGTGTSSHMGCVLLNQQIGIKVTHVPYRGAGPALQDLVGGRIDYICNYISTAIPVHQSGTGRVIAAMTGKRTSSFPDIPTAEEQGFPGLDVSAWNAIFLPRNSPPAYAAKLAAAISKAQDNPAFRKRLEDIGLEIPDKDRRGPEYLAKYVASEIARWEVPVKASGVQFD
jgi:tripartite-type tricarboxylate transporter receptor subunit TctC